MFEVKILLFGRARIGIFDSEARRHEKKRTAEIAMSCKLETLCLDVRNIRVYTVRTSFQCDLKTYHKYPLSNKQKQGLEFNDLTVLLNGANEESKPVYTKGGKVQYYDGLILLNGP